MRRRTGCQAYSDSEGRARASGNGRALGEADHTSTIYYAGTTGIHNTLGAQRRQGSALPGEVEKTLGGLE